MVCRCKKQKYFIENVIAEGFSPNKMKMILGDLRAKVGEVPGQKMVRVPGAYRSGDGWILMCEKRELHITNTFMKKVPKVSLG